MPLPTCRIDWCALSAVIDSDDPDREPDAVPLAHLSVKFTAGRARLVTTSPPETVFLHPIEWKTDGDGYLVSPDGQRGLYLVASDIDPENVWTWTVRISSTPTSPHQITAVSYSFVAPSGGSIDLSTVIPVPAVPARDLPAWQEAVSTTTAARDETLIARDETLDARDDALAAATTATNAATTTTAARDETLAARDETLIARDETLIARDDALDARDETVTNAASTLASKTAAAASATTAQTAATTATNAATTAAIGGFLSGTGSPLGVVSAPVGSQYRDTAATTGAVIWVKASGTGNTGWVVQYGDTGWRQITPLNVTSGTVAIRRFGSTVLYRVSSIVVAAGSGNVALHDGTARLPAGFQGHVDSDTDFRLRPFSTVTPIHVVALWSRHALSLLSPSTRPTSPLIGTLRWGTDDPWPTTLPGTPTA